MKRTGRLEYSRRRRRSFPPSLTGDLTRVHFVLSLNVHIDRESKSYNTMVPAASRASIIRLLSLTSNQGCRGCGRTHAASHLHPNPVSLGHTHPHPLGLRGMATPVGGFRSGPPPGDGDYAFEVGRSCIFSRVQLTHADGCFESPFRGACDPRGWHGFHQYDLPDARC